MRREPLQRECRTWILPGGCGGLRSQVTYSLDRKSLNNIQEVRHVQGVQEGASQHEEMEGFEGHYEDLGGTQSALRPTPPTPTWPRCSRDYPMIDVNHATGE
jgi:hypothetical protein